MAKVLVVENWRYRKEAEREAQTQRSEYLRRAQHQEELRDVDWDTIGTTELPTIPTLIWLIIGAICWTGMLFWLV